MINTIKSGDVLVEESFSANGNDILIVINRHQDWAYKVYYLKGKWWQGKRIGIHSDGYLRDNFVNCREKEKRKRNDCESW